MLMRANIENLTAFWKACGTKDFSLPGGSLLHGSVSWPWRMWFDYDHHPDRRDLEQLLSQAERVDGPVTIPQWHAEDEIMAQILDEAGFAVGMTQEAMVARLSAETADDGHSDVGLRWATGPESARPWTRVASESFGYVVDERSRPSSRGGGKSAFYGVRVPRLAALPRASFRRPLARPPLP